MIEKSPFYSSGKNTITLSLSDIVRNVRHGLPTANTEGGIFFVTMLPAPITELSPMLTPGNMVTFPPIQTLSPMCTGRERHNAFVALRGVERMFHGINTYIWTNENIVADDDLGFVKNSQIKIANKVFSNRDLCSKVAMERAVKYIFIACTPHYFSDYAVAFFFM